MTALKMTMAMAAAYIIALESVKPESQPSQCLSPSGKTMSPT